MADSELNRIRERIAQNSTSLAAARAALAENPNVPECRLGCTFFAGERVLDFVSGYTGVVDSVVRENVLQSAPRSSTPSAGGSLAGLPNSEILETVVVRFADGTTSVRRARELQKLPTPPAGR